jgi:hypothetical protein
VITFSYSVMQPLILQLVAEAPTCRQLAVDSSELMEGLPESDSVWGANFSGV